MNKKIRDEIEITDEMLDEMYEWEMHEALINIVNEMDNQKKDEKLDNEQKNK